MPPPNKPSQQTTQQVVRLTIDGQTTQQWYQDAIAIIHHAIATKKSYQLEQWSLSHGWYTAERRN